MNQAEDALKDQIGMFESILSRLPKDRFSIEELIRIHASMGNCEEEQNYRLLLDELNRGETPTVKMAKPSSFKQGGTRSIRRTLKTTKAKPIIAWPEAPKDEQYKWILAPNDLPHFTLQSQVDLVFLLKKAGLINDSQLAEVFYSLSRCVFDGNRAAFSVLHIIRDLCCVDERRLLYYLSYRTELPYIDLSMIDCDKESRDWLPHDFILRECATFFKKSGDIYCMVLLNPLNIKLMESVKSALNGNVSFFLTSVEEFENFIVG